MSIYYKYAPYGSKIIVLYYADDCIYWYKSEALGKWSVVTLEKILHVNFLGYAHWFTSIGIYQIKDHSISVDQARYYTSCVANYFYTDTFNASTNFYNATLPSDMIL